MFWGGSGVNGEPSPEHRCGSLTDAVLVQTRMLSAQVHYCFSYSQTQPQKDYFIIFTLLAPRDWSLVFNRQKLLEPSKQKDNHWVENRGWGGPTGICSKRMQVSMVPRGWVCIRATATPWAWGGEGAAQAGGWGHFSVTTSYQGGRGPPWCQRAGTVFPGDSAWREGRDGDN